ncbi:MAG: hypothetical protein WA945_08760 [Arcobacteraceae bacterium]
MHRTSKFLFFGLTITNKSANQILDIFKLIDTRCNTVKDCETIFISKFDIYNDQDESFQDLFIKCRDIVILRNTYTIDEFVLFIYKFIYPYLLEETRNSIYQNNPYSTFDPINKQILEESEDEAKNDLNALLPKLRNFLLPDIFKEIDSHYNDKQKKFALNGTLEFLKTFEEFEHYNDFDKAINNLGNLSKNKEKQLFKYLAVANLNYISAENEIFYIDIVNIVLSVAKIYQMLEQNEKIINRLKDIIEDLSNSLDTVILSNLLTNLMFILPQYVKTTISKTLF